MKEKRITLIVTRKKDGFVRTVEIRNFDKRNFFYKAYIKVMRLLGNEVEEVKWYGKESRNSVVNHRFSVNCNGYSMGGIRYVNRPPMLSIRA